MEFIPLTQSAGGHKCLKMYDSQVRHEAFAIHIDIKAMTAVQLEIEK